MSVFQIDWELLLTVGMVFSAENILDLTFQSTVEGFWIEIIGWGALFVLMTYLASEEAEENDTAESR